MASYAAKLEIDGQEYPVVLCSYGFEQATDARGRINERVRHGLLELVLDVPAGDQLLVWAATPHYPLDGHVSFFQVSGLMASETVSFKAGQCIGYQEVFEAGADIVGSYRCSLTIAAAQLDLTAGGAASGSAQLAGSGIAGVVAQAQQVYATAQQVRATATQATQAVAAVRAGAQDLGQLATHGLPAGADALAQGAGLAALGSIVPEVPRTLTDQLPALPGGDLPLGL
ncbi:MAG: type VI secretion system tube protein TssD [Janthinobacterium lividum]